MPRLPQTLNRVVSVIVPAPMRDAIIWERARHLPRETGGFLLGLRRGLCIELLEYTPQAPMDIANRASFERVDPEHQQRALKAWLKAEGLVGLIGDWHSHPHGSGQPSGTDRAAWRALAQAIGGAGIGVIVGGEELAVFALNKDWKGLKVERLPLFAQDAKDFVFGNPEASERR